MCIIPLMLLFTAVGCIIDPPHIKSRHARGYTRPRYRHERRRAGMTFKCFIYDGPRPICSTLVNADNAEAAETAAGFKFAAYFPNAEFTRIKAIKA